MKWGGEVAGQRTEGKPKPLVGLYVEAPLLTEVTEGLQELQLDITISEVELEILEDLQSLLRKPDVETRDVDKLLHSYLGLLLFLQLLQFNIPFQPLWTVSAPPPPTSPF